MKLKDAVILWNPLKIKDPRWEAGKVQVIERGVDEDDRSCMASHGAVLQQWIDDTDEGRMASLFRLYILMVEHDGIDPSRVRAAFWRIDEFRDMVWREEAWGMPAA